jgi:hypothetical protein
MDRLENIRNIIRSLNEEGMVVGNGGFTGSSPAAGPTAGFDPVANKPKKNSKKYIYKGKNSRKVWMR